MFANVIVEVFEPRAVKLTDLFEALFEFDKFEFG